MSEYSIADIARASGLGLGTVARVLQRHPQASEHARSQVLHTLEVLELPPARVPAPQPDGRLHTVSMIVPLVSTPFYQRLIDSLAGALNEEHYDLALFTTTNVRRARRRGRPHIAHQADGIIMTSPGPEADSRYLPCHSGAAVVVVDAPSAGYDCAYIDHSHGARQAADLALKAGHDIHLVKADVSGLPTQQRATARQTYREFARRLAECGRVVAGDHRAPDEASARHFAHDLLDHVALPCTVITDCQAAAHALLDRAESRGLAIGQLQVIALNRSPWAQRRGLSAAYQPVEAMGRAAAALLLARLGGYDGPPRTYVSHPHFPAPA